MLYAHYQVAKMILGLYLSRWKCVVHYIFMQDMVKNIFIEYFSRIMYEQMQAHYFCDTILSGTSTLIALTGAVRHWFLYYCLSGAKGRFRTRESLYASWQNNI